MTAATLAQILLDTGAIQVQLEQPFTLASGKKSPVYVDCRKLLGYPQACQYITQSLQALLFKHCGFDQVDVIAGGETAGIPYAAMLSQALHLPMAYVRKKPKGYGKNAQIEGADVAGKRVVLIEDLASNGYSKAVFIEALRKAEAEVSTTLVIFHYGIFPPHPDLLEMGVEIIGLATWHDVLHTLEAEQRMPRAALTELKAFLEEPEAWQQRYA